MMLSLVLAAALHTFSIGETEFLLDGKPFQVRCGEMHFARIPKPYWRHRIRMCRAMGLNAVCAYLFWNNHEQTPGTFDFTGERDAAEFCRIAQEEGMWVMLRPGPYVCAEWEFGGLPWWLLDKGEEGVRVRSTDPKFMEPAARYLKEMGKVLAPLQVTRGGPILMVQVENEYGSFGADPEYMRAMYRAMRAAGFEVPLFACNGPVQLPNGRIPELFDVVNFGGDPEGCFKELRKFRKTGPLMNGEYYPGWFDTWGKAHHTKKFDAVIKEIGWMLEHRASFSIYMAHGGTTFGWWAGCNTPYQPQASSYDYEAPISEAGHVTEKFFGIRDLCAKYLNPGETIPDPPAQIPVTAFVAKGRAAVASLAGAKEIPITAPTTIERLGLGYGIGVFRRELSAGEAGVLSCTNVRDHAAVLVDGRLAGFLDRRYPDLKVRLPASVRPRRLELVVEAMGRFNFGKNGLPFASKGIVAPVTLDGKPLAGGWTFEAYPFADMGCGKGYAFGAETDLAALKASPASLVRIRFPAKGGSDAYLDVGGWPHGLVWLNGHPLGRYWAIGPTRTMYVPGCWLEDGENELTVWDLKGFPACGELRFLDHPILDELHPERDLADFANGGVLKGVDSAAEQIKSNVSGGDKM